MASCRLCGDEQLGLDELCERCQLCELCCTCLQDDPGIQLADELSDMQDDDRGYFWERY